MLTTIASQSEGWMHARFISPWAAGWMIGVREEGIKLLFFLIMADRDPETRSAGDRFLAMTAVALGFAVEEAIGKSTPYNGMTRMLPAFYTNSYSGVAMHVFLSLQAVGFLILSRTRSCLWLAGLAVPMAIHSIWDGTVLIGVTAPGPAYALRIAVMSGNVVLALGLARSVHASPRQRAAGRVAGPSALILLLLCSTSLQALGLIGWHYGVTVKPYGLMITSWLMLGIDMIAISTFARMRQKQMVQAALMSTTNRPT